MRARPVPADLAEVVRGDLGLTVDEDGRTRIRERYVVSSPIAGRLRRIELRAGDGVERGRTIVASVDPMLPDLLDERVRQAAQARVKAAAAAKERAAIDTERVRKQSDFADSEFRRLGRMVVTGAAPAQELDAAQQSARLASDDLRSAEFAARIAAFELEQAEAALVYGRPAAPGDPEPVSFDIRAPVDGRVLHVLQESATVVAAGAPLVEIGNPRDLEVEIDVLSRDAVRIAAGAAVVFDGWGGPAPLHGRVRRVEPAGFTKLSALGVEEQRVHVIADLTDPPETWSALGDGYRVEARILVEIVRGAIIVPTSALFRDASGSAVFTVSLGRAVRRRVEAGRSDGRRTEVLLGLEPGERVILHPGDKVAEGVEVVAR